MGFGGTRSALAGVTFLACTVGLTPDAYAQRRGPPKGTKEAPASAAPTGASPATAPTSSAPTNKARATELFKKGSEAYLRGDFAQTIALLDEAYALDPQPVLIYNKARAHEGLGHLDDAQLSRPDPVGKFGARCPHQLRRWHVRCCHDDLNP